MAEELQGQKKSKSKSGIKVLAAIILGLSIGLLLGLITIRLIRGELPFSSAKFRGVELPTPQPVADFTLTAHTGQEVSLSDFRGQITLLYFGYTYCPDICPGTLAELARAMDELDSQDRDNVQVIMVTVDPARDTPEVLAGYLDHFDASFSGLTGSDADITAAAADVGIFYQKQPGTVESGYLVDHTASISALDREGNIKVIFKFGTPAEDIAADLKRLLAG